MGFLRNKPCVNKTLISLKVVVFFVISGITALHVLYSIKPKLLGINFVENRNITIIAAFVSILGPLIVGPLADRLAAKNANNFGKKLRYLTAFCLLIAAIIFGCLFAIPDVQREEASRLNVSFGCDANGAVVFQQRCSEENTCHHWEEKVGTLELTKCTYDCQDPSQYQNMYMPLVVDASVNSNHNATPTPSPSKENSSEYDYDEESTTESMRAKRAALKSLVGSAENVGAEVLSGEVKGKAIEAPIVQPPHLCIKGRDESGNEVVKNCHVYTGNTKSLKIHSVLGPAINAENDTHSADWCQYPLAGLQCHVSKLQVDYMNKILNKTDCKGIVKCQVVNPYESKGSVLADSECIAVIGNLGATIGGYTIIRLLGDIFTLAALTLLNTAIVIAVRETSEGRGEVCRQYVWGAIGYVLLFSPLNFAIFDKEPSHTAGLVALILVIVCFVIGALVLLCASQMPLSPPEWWWHTKTGVTVFPMSAIRRYSPEIFLLALISILFGTFWSTIHSFLTLTFTDLCGARYAGIILIFVLFFNVDKFIEYCGHSNIFIAGFALFIIRFTALSGEETRWLTGVMEAIEPTIIGIIWITIIIYLRHTMPRKLTATGQALAVLAFFGLGKGFGAIISLARDDKKPIEGSSELYQWLAIICCLIALIYFIIYNLILAPRCAAKPQHLEELISGSASQNFSNGANGSGAGAAGAGGATNGAGAGAGAGASLNGNGNYSPLRVYHNERGKKGQFRY